MRRTAGRLDDYRDTEGYDPAPHDYEAPAVTCNRCETRQLSLVQGLALKAAGLDQCEGRNWPFIERARAQARYLAILHGRVTVDDLRAWASACGIRPASCNAWGAIFKGRGWKPIGRTRSEWTTNRARTVVVWAYTMEATS